MYVYCRSRGSFIVNKNIAESDNMVGPIRRLTSRMSTGYFQAGAGVDVRKFTLDIRYQIGLK